MAEENQELKGLPAPLEVEIERVMHLKGAFVEVKQSTYVPMWVHAHVSKPVNVDGESAQYALLTSAPHHGFTTLGEIDPATLEFKEYGSELSLYERGSNGRIEKMKIPLTQFNRLQKIEDVLNIPGITVDESFS